MHVQTHCILSVRLRPGDTTIIGENEIYNMRNSGNRKNSRFGIEVFCRFGAAVFSFFRLSCLENSFGAIVAGYSSVLAEHKYGKQHTITSKECELRC